ncbi:HNH endonuclease [Alteromonas phage vB_AmeM_PT11-V22]|uniref:Anti-sigma factor n=1 Tax=Alteromonas phage vB_AmeM_PT11-V22 TaxID=2704031 RepID=A0A6C0R0P0_9CAUD|nr:HNH endonuclease [Alteromonas phage vB_AmeM_PT11-V22]QHZ59800.1 anti-sigma factor [Alteromonas phage vB_AmeM_PT11-V22]
MIRSDWLKNINRCIDQRNREELDDYFTRFPSFKLSSAIEKKLLQVFPDMYQEPTTVSVSGIDEGEPFDVMVARKLSSKYNNAKERGIEFGLSFTSVKNIMKAKKCYYTGLPLTKRTLTIDRIDSNKGYVKGNVVACHTDANSFKNIIESGHNGLDLKQATKLISKWNKSIK